MIIRKKITLFFNVIFLSTIIALCVADVDNVEAKSDDGDYIEGVYMRYCSQCHGLKGRGDGVNSTPDMSVNPRDHTDNIFMSTRTDSQLAEVIRGGGTSVAKSPLMPPWKNTLEDSEIKSLVKYLRGLCECEFTGVASHEELRGVDEGFR
jgi:mono/diheme cytochrome c family protein